ncbi:hypothetical protein ACQP2U_23215 [Nocardia sp. CA-084685]|uniref:hypothetical protein n=1 Tax=Nocardia sp. CA-084685 TaxID=3239970 RepID=UPI003D951347
MGFESWLERDEAMALDFDPNAVSFAAQPLWLSWLLAAYIQLRLAAARPPS